MKHELLIPFSDPSPSFVNGAEFGRILRDMEKGEPIAENQGFPIHPENAEVLRSACAAYGYTPAFGEIDHGWQAFRAVKLPAQN